MSPHPDIDPVLIERAHDVFGSEYARLLTGPGADYDEHADAERGALEAVILLVRDEFTSSLSVNRADCSRKGGDSRVDQEAGHPAVSSPYPPCADALHGRPA